MDSFLTDLFLGQPVWMWLTFFGLVLALLVFDLGVLHRGSKEIGARESLILSAFYITVGVAFAGFVWWQLGPTPAVEYLTGFVVEKSLAMDNVFVIALIFATLAIPRAYQYRVLFWGILGVLVLRGIMIGFGTAIVSEFGWVLYVFAAFLVFTGIRMMVAKGHGTDMSESRILQLARRRLPVTDRLHGDRFFVREAGADGRLRRFVTPLFLALIMIETADVIFAVDSVPAIFAITTDPFIVYTSNIFAILGLRALYFALAAVLHRFAYLKQALAILLIFIGSKVFVADLLGLGKFPPAWSLGITFAILAAGIGYSIWRTRGEPPAPAGHPEQAAH
ncbi:MAG: TerC family protein [Bauldia sp.]|nr:TerC family protein [Bauldia sp.]